MSSSSESTSTQAIAPDNKDQVYKDQDKKDQDYKDSVNLPQTKFSMRANAKEREPEIQRFWQEEQIYAQLSENNPGEKFILHDGPPYANGSLHMGHALNKVLKDIINRYQILRGRKVRYVLGWDCHGLPIELKVIQNLKPEQRKSITPLELRHKARDFALEAIADQAKGFQRWGIWGEYENPYYTLKPEYEAAQIAVFGKMALKGYIYRGLRPVYWSPSSQTALAEAELEYPEDHSSRSIYVAFKLKQLNSNLDLGGLKLESVAALIWTTTPWTIPANLAIAVNPKLNYSLVCLKSTEDDSQSATQPQNYLIVATDLIGKLAKTLEQELTIISSFLGEVLEGVICQHPLFERESPILLGDYVTAESGTGLVHTAPGHGQDDFAIGKKYGLAVLAPIDDYGNFTIEAGAEFVGLNILKDGNGAVIDALSAKGALLKEENYKHKYPYDWRTKKPVVLRATEQWFASVAGFREEALKAIKEVNWIPASGENRITPMVQERSDWCISRQRSWGLPIPVFYDMETNQPLINQDTISHIQSIFRDQGSDAWWQLSIEELLPESYRHNGRTYRKGMDTMDVWFDSGSSWAAVIDQRTELGYPADLYLEGSDQHRGWFQSSLLTSVAANGHAPYKTVLTHGFVLDEKGQKMSKSLGNVVDPMIIINGGKNEKQEPAFGADVLRLWAASVDYQGDVPIGKNIINQTADVARKIRNTARFLLSNLYDFNPAEDAIAYQDLPELDRYMLHSVYIASQEITQAYDQYQFSRVCQTIQNLCTVDLSNFYLDIAKDRLYISAANAFRRRSCQTVIMYCVEIIAKAIAPILSHTAEDIWSHIPYEVQHKSVFQAGWLNSPEAWHQPELATKWEMLRSVRDEVNKKFEIARNNKVIGSSLESKVIFNIPDCEENSLLLTSLLSLGDELPLFFITSQAEFGGTYHSHARLLSEKPNKPYEITVWKASGEKCPRCWNYSTKFGESETHPLLCDRCVEALS
jgi:isoleucyl-tRNA synthetase